jgi:hypothetical protein
MNKGKDMIRPEAGGNFEAAAVQEVINVAAVKRRTEKKIKISELIDQRVEDAIPPLPAPLKAMIMEDYLRFKELTDDEEVLTAAIEVSYQRIICGYERRITDEEKVPNEAYARLNAMEKIDALFGGEKDPAPEDLKKVAHVTFDLNGLKAVNDYNDHDNKKGDIYLLLAVKAISSPAAVEYARKNGINFEPEKVTRDGGDEFSAIVTSGKPLTKEVLEGFILTIQAALWENDDVAKILDFNNPNVLANHAGVPVANIGSKFAGDIERFKEAYGIPLKYKYRGAMSGGAITLYDALVDEKFDEKNKINAGDQYPYMLQKMMGAMFSISGKKMDSDKKRFKRGLAGAAADDIIAEFSQKGSEHIEISRLQAQEEASHRRFLAEVYSRTDVEKELMRENFQLRKENREFKDKQELIKSEISLAAGILDKAEKEEDWKLVKKAAELLKRLSEEK